MLDEDVVLLGGTITVELEVEDVVDDVVELLEVLLVVVDEDEVVEELLEELEDELDELEEEEVVWTVYVNLVIDVAVPPLPPQVAFTM